MFTRFTEGIYKVAVVLFGLWLAFIAIAHLVAEILWFQEVNYLATFIKSLTWQLGLGLLASGLSALFLLINLRIARRLKWHQVAKTTPQYGKRSKISNREENDNLDRRPQSPVIGLSVLLPIVVGFSLLIGLILLYYGQEVIRAWQSDFSLFRVKPPILFPFEIKSFSPQIFAEIFQHLWQFGGLIAIVILLLLNPEFWLKAIAVVISAVFGLLLSGNWTKALLMYSHYFKPTFFNQVDPILREDIGFYVFDLPLRELLDFFAIGLFLYALVAVSLVYLLSANSISEAKFPGFSRPQLRHIYALGGLLMSAVAAHHWLRRYELLYSELGVVYGAGYTDVKVQMPLESILSFLALGLCVWLFLKARQTPENKQEYWKVNPRKVKKISLFLFPLGAYLIAIVAGAILSVVVQRLDVQPNELTREVPYIENSINLTRAGFNLEEIEIKSFDPEGELTATDLQLNYLTVDNIRLWDTRPLLQTNRQLQQIRLYYKFPDADIDRYTLKVEQGKGASLALAAEKLLGNGNSQSQQQEINSPSPSTGKKQQVIIAPRELDYSSVPERAKTWVNQHFVYTHGYGFTLSPVNQVNEESGLPEYFVKDIGTPTEQGTLRTSSELIRDSIPIGNPRIYYGELTNTYVMTNTKVQELDFPSGQGNAYNTYDGTGGINIGSFGQRLLFAQYLKDWRMLFARNLTQDTRILLRREIKRRVEAIAPFLHYDRDPYLVVADAGDANQGKSPNYLHWIIDAYTISDHYPYSDPGNNKFNYIRNSVKIVVDAYNGDIDFYIAEPSDPIIQTWSHIFPDLFKPLDAMPAILRSHIRYPGDLFNIQSERLRTYHMTDPQVFYNREDQWQIAREIYGTELQRVEPYYLIMKLPTANSEEFILINLYTPTSRNNLISVLFGRSDGAQYGKLLLYTLPKQQQIYGPEQIDARINQDPKISREISLWNRQGSRVIQGNLLVIPIENSLLYVEPLYLEAERNSLPTLARVIVIYENRIVMATTLQQALEKAILEPEQQLTPTVTGTIEEIPGAIENPALENTSPEP